MDTAQSLWLTRLPSGGGTKGAIDDNQIRRFVAIDLGWEAAPYTTTLHEFRQMLEKRRMTDCIFATINTHLADKGLLLKEDMVVEAKILSEERASRDASD